MQKDHGSARKGWKTFLSYEIHHFLRGHSTVESGGSKSAKLSEESCETMLLSPCILMTRPPRPAEQQPCSTAVRRENGARRAKSKPAAAKTVSMLRLLRCFGQTLNLRGEFICFQSLLGFSSLGYWPKGTEKCNVDNKLPIKKNNIAALSLQVLRGFTQVYDWTFSSEKWGWAE